jgi:hypothetical protein
LSRIIKKSGADIMRTRNWGAFAGVLASCFHPRVIVDYSVLSVLRLADERQNLAHRAFICSSNERNCFFIALQ